jgi:peptidoglycan-associated lipoprotein
MDYRQSLLGLVLVSATVVFGGCSSTAEKPAAAPSPAASAPTETKKQFTSAPSSASSLEALKRGESTATAAESPLKEVYFDFDKYDLRPDARETLKANATWLKANPTAQVQIEGHCDERGTNEYNMALGYKRAQSVKDYLVTLGIGAERLTTISYGEELPVCREHNEGCWQKNRRAKFVIQPAKPTA